MKLLRTIRQDDIGAGTHRLDIKYKLRHAARAVLSDGAGKIALLHAAERDYYKLPGGGVEGDEDMQIALARELLEEVGAAAEVTGEIGRVEEWRDYGDSGSHQISDAYTAKVSGEVGKPDFTESELAEGFSVVWANGIQDAIEKVETALESPHAEVRFMTLRDATILREAKGLGKL